MASARVRSFVAEENRSPEEILELISTQQRNCGLSVDDKLKVAFYGLFSENIVEEICQHAQVFKKLMTSEEAQQSLLSLIECFVILKEPQVLRSMPVILKVCSFIQLLIIAIYFCCTCRIFTMVIF